jgi:2-polyprenyl-3-methyl-5-hydroxy-6-metoxy-1,4-benzoquinol methylase
MLVSTPCNFCNSDNYTTLAHVTLSPIHERSWLVRCKRCGLAYVNPRPTLEREREFYNHEYFKPEEERLWREHRLPLLEKVLSRIESIIPRGRLLDVGCGKGYFLGVARKRGWQAVGVEVSSTAVQFARDTLHLEVYSAELKEAGLEANPFDVVTAWNVLDQIHDPLENLREIYKTMRKGGLIALRVSNLHFHLYLHHVFNLINLSVHSKIKAPTVFHLYMFSPDTLRRFLREAGFVDIRIENSILDPQVPDLVSLVGEVGEVVVRNTAYFWAQTLYYLSMGSLLVSPSLLAFARKPG